jgi:photosystem II stability/assembly factor-like uncharacterized protein
MRHGDGAKRRDGDKSPDRRFSASLRLLFLLLTAHCLPLTGFAGTWTRQPSGTMAWLHAVYFLDQNRGWVCGSAGTLLSTTDGGQTWRKLQPLGRDSLRDVFFADQNVGWLLAERDPLKLQTADEPRSYLMKTEDGGFSWRRVFLSSPGANPRLVRLAFLSPERGWVFGETGVVFATSDGGAHWLRLATPTKHLLLGGAFINQWRGWLVGASATMMQTRDGGLTWETSLPNYLSTRLTAVTFVNDRLGWAVGATGRIVSTIDGGRSWVPQTSTVDVDLLDVKFIDGVNGFIVGNEGTILHTTDGGAHWLADHSGTTHALDRLFLIDQNQGWTVGFGGTILNYRLKDAPHFR